MHGISIRGRFLEGFFDGEGIGDLDGVRDGVGVADRVGVGDEDGLSLQVNLGGPETGHLATVQYLYSAALVNILLWASHCRPGQL